MTWIYLIFALLIIAMLVWTSLRALRETPTREVSVQLPNRGWVTIRLKTIPFPPLSARTVELSLTSQDRRGGMVDLGESIPFIFGARDSETALDIGKASRDGPTYRAGIQFHTPGDYWLIFDLGNGYQAKFQLYVKPAQ